MQLDALQLKCSTLNFCMMIIEAHENTENTCQSFLLHTKKNDNCHFFTNKIYFNIEGGLSALPPTIK